jgi:hypothetical protein
MNDAMPMTSTDQMSPRDRFPYWTDRINRLSCGLQCDLQDGTEFDGHSASVHAGDVVLTRLESNRHRVMRSASQARGSDLGYLKIVAPLHGCAGVERKGRAA